MKNILFPLVVAALAAPGYAQNPRTPIQLDAGLGKAVGPAISSDGDLSAVIWKEDVTNQMFASTSTDNGCTWSTAIRIDDSPNANSKFANDVGLIVDGGVIYASWSGQRTTVGEDDLYFTMSTDGGATWTADLAIDKGYANGANDLKDWRMSVDGTMVAFMSATENDAGGAHEEVFLTVSTDRGATFGAAMAASAHPNGSVDVDAIGMTASNGLVHMVWQDNVSTTDNELFYSSFDSATGLFVSTDVLLSASLAGGNVENDIAIDSFGATIAVAYQADNLPAGSAHILHVATSIDNGTSFAAGVQVGNYVAGTNDTDHPVILVNSNGNITTCHEDNRNLGSDEIFMNNSTDGGATWTESAAMGFGGFPAIAGDGDYVAGYWTGPSFPEGTPMTVSRDGGANFGPALDITGGQTGDADFAEITFNSKYHNFVTVWLDDTATGVNECFAGGLRSGGISPVGPFTAGGPINFTGAGFGASEAGNEFMVLVSTAKGTAAIPGDGRSVGLAFGPVLLQSAAAAPLKGTILADGTAVTPVVNFPGSFAVGTTLSCVALSHAGANFDAITDVATFTVQ
ncbi:MAG: sialidase family protein [Planctomycetota bacterium]|nr:sialidase family protein [Planctomycetota bacterium]MDA1113884.1 sialidase family protein [Planctomycetota bacterium]